MAEGRELVPMALTRQLVPMALTLSHQKEARKQILGSSIGTRPAILRRRQRRTYGTASRPRPTRPTSRRAAKRAQRLQGQFRAWCMAEQGKEREAAEKRKQAEADDAAKKARTKRRDAALNAISTMVEMDGEAEFWLLVRQIFTDSDIRVVPKK